MFDLRNLTVRIGRWYDLQSKVTMTSHISEDNAVAQTKQLLVNSIKHRLVSDVPVGSCLSGGIDSSSIVGVMHQLTDKGQIKLFSLVFPGLGIDESKFINRVARSVNAELHCVSPTPDELAADLKDLVWTQEEPFPSLSVYGQYRVMKLAHENGMKVLLDGQGGDEVLAGYDSYFASYLIECLVEGRVHEFLKVLSKRSCSKRFLLQQLGALLFGKFRLTNRLLRKIRRKRFPQINFDCCEDLVTEPYRISPSLNGALYYDIVSGTIPVYLRFEDKNSMRWSVESRLPFLDYRLVESLLTFSASFKLKDGVRKHGLRRAMKDIVDQTILNREDKIGFATPDQDWILSAPFMDVLKSVFSSPEFGSRPYWKQEKMLALLESSSVSNLFRIQLVWRVLCVEMWHRIFIDHHSLEELERRSSTQTSWPVDGPSI